MTFAQRVFRWSGIYGVIAVLPHFFLEKRIGHLFPPRVTHPEYFYGFVGIALMWQAVFLLISTNPERFRPLMILAIGEKLTFAVAVFVLVALGRTAPAVLLPASIDFVLAFLFFAAYRVTEVKA